VGFPHVQLPAWTLEDLLSATDDQPFYEQTTLCHEEKFDNRTQFIASKFNVTGGAPRLMFECSTKEAEIMLQGALNRLCLQEKRQVLFGELKPSHDRSQSSLIHYFVNPSPDITDNAERYEELLRKFSSQFVLRQLQSVLNLADIHKLYTQCRAINRVMEGWAFEELMLRKLSDQPGQIQSLTVRHETSTATAGQQWITTRLISLHMKRFAKGKLTDIGDRLMLRPDVCNNESWDAVIVERASSKNWQLKFLKITLEDTHPLSEMVIVQAFNVFQKVLGNVLPTVFFEKSMENFNSPRESEEE